MKKLFILTLLALSTTVIAQEIHLPVVLMQRLPWAPATINVGGKCSIDIILDTANYVDIITAGTFTEVDSMKFPTGKITLDETTKQLTIDKSISFKNGIRVHTTSRDIIVNAIDFASVMLRSSSGNKAALNRLVLRSDNLAMIDVKTPIEANDSEIESKGYSWIRHDLLSGPQKNTIVKGNGRIVEIGETNTRIQESPYSFWFNPDHSSFPFFMDFSFGATTLGSFPFYNPYVKGSNFNWSIKSLSCFSYQFYASVWSNSNWSLMLGFGMKAEDYNADNTYLDLVEDTITSSFSLQALDASSLFASEELANGKILWNSTITGNVYIMIPIRFEWRSRADYKGFRIGAELHPSMAIVSKNVVIRHFGHYADKNMQASTSNEKIGKLINPFRLDMRLTAGYGKVAFFAQTSLTPLFRTKTDNPVSKPMLNKKLFPTSFGITLSF